MAACFAASLADSSIPALVPSATAVATGCCVLAHSLTAAATLFFLAKLSRRLSSKLLFNALFLLAQQKKMPLILDSLDDAVSFYEKVGMLHLNDPEVQKRVKFGNVISKKLSEKIDNDDFIWIPKHIRKKPIIFL